METPAGDANCMQRTCRPKLSRATASPNSSYPDAQRSGNETITRRMVWRTSRSRNILGSGDTALIPDYLSDSSESEFVEEEKPWPPGVGGDRTSRSKRRAPPRFPRPHSHLFRYSEGQRLRGNKHARRWENCKCGDGWAGHTAENHAYILSQFQCCTE